MSNTTLIIIGGGPAGLTAGIYAARAGLQPVIATGNLPGGQLLITTDVENYPGFPDNITGPELVDRMRQQAIQFGAVIIDEQATNFKFSNNSKHQVTIGNQLYEADAIILANGAKARWLGANNESLYINKGISGCATCDAFCFRGKHMVVVGGGDSACEEALFITRFATQVTLIHRRDTLRASKIMIDRVLNHDKINILWNTRIVGYYGNNELEGVFIVTDDEKDTLDCSAVFMAIGHTPNTAELHGSGIVLDKEGYITVRDNVYTDIQGVFAAGDCHDTHYRQAITAAGFGCMASIAAERWLGEK